VFSNIGPRYQPPLPPSIPSTRVTASCTPLLPTYNSSPFPRLHHTRHNFRDGSGIRRRPEQPSRCIYEKSDERKCPTGPTCRRRRGRHQQQHRRRTLAWLGARGGPAGGESFTKNKRGGGTRARTQQARASADGTGTPRLTPPSRQKSGERVKTSLFDRYAVYRHMPRRYLHKYENEDTATRNPHPPANLQRGQRASMSVLVGSLPETTSRKRGKSLDQLFLLK